MATTVADANPKTYLESDGKSVDVDLLIPY